MISGKIKSLFQFIDFLHSNIEHFKQYDDILMELYDLNRKRSQLKPNDNYKEMLAYKKVDAEIKMKFEQINKNIIQVINDKAKDLNIWDLKDFATIYNFNSAAICDLHNNFDESDISEIILFKEKYTEFRTDTNSNYFQDIFFNSLDSLLNELFEFFNETSKNYLTPLSLGQIDRFYNARLESFKIYGNIETLLGEYKAGKYKGTWKATNYDKKYIVLMPDIDETGKYSEWIQLKRWHEGLIELRQLQIKYHEIYQKNEDGNYKILTEIESQIKVWYEQVFKTGKPNVKQPELDEKIKKALHERTKNLSRDEKYNLIKQYVIENAEKEFDEYVRLYHETEEAERESLIKTWKEKHFQKPNKLIDINSQIWKDVVIKEFDSSELVQNNILQVDSNLRYSSPQIDTWIGWEVWKLWELKESKDNQKNGLKSNTDIPKEPTKDEDIKKIKEILKPLSGYWKREKIMNNKDFQLLEKTVLLFIENETIPKIENRINQTKASSQFIRHTFWEIYNYRGKKRKERFIELLHNLFTQFNDAEESTTSSKFKTYEGNYNNDIKNYITY